MQRLGLDLQAYICSFLSRAEWHQCNCLSNDWHWLCQGKIIQNYLKQSCPQIRKLETNKFPINKKHYVTWFVFKELFYFLFKRKGYALITVYDNTYVLRGNIKVQLSHKRVQATRIWVAEGFILLGCVGEDFNELYKLSHTGRTLQFWSIPKGVEFTHFDNRYLLFYEESEKTIYWFTLEGKCVSNMQLRYADMMSAWFCLGRKREIVVLADWEERETQQIWSKLAFREHTIIVYGEKGDVLRSWKLQNESGFRAIWIALIHPRLLLVVEAFVREKPSTRCRLKLFSLDGKLLRSFSELSNMDDWMAVDISSSKLYLIDDANMLSTWEIMNRLSRDIQFYLFQYLNRNEWRRCTNVSKLWHEICKAPLVKTFLRFFCPELKKEAQSSISLLKTKNKCSWFVYKTKFYFLLKDPGFASIEIINPNLPHVTKLIKIPYYNSNIVSTRVWVVARFIIIAFEDRNDANGVLLLSHQGQSLRSWNVKKSFQFTHFANDHLFFFESSTQAVMWYTLEGKCTHTWKMDFIDMVPTWFCPSPANELFVLADWEEPIIQRIWNPNKTSHQRDHTIIVFSKTGQILRSWKIQNKCGCRGIWIALIRKDLLLVIERYGLGVTEIKYFLKLFSLDGVLRYTTSEASTMVAWLAVDIFSGTLHRIDKEKKLTTWELC